MRPISVEFLSSSKTAHLHTEPATRSAIWSRKQPAFIPPDLWPPNSPDLNPVDYKIWGLVQQRVYQSRIHDVEELKQRLLDIWHGLEQLIAQLTSGEHDFTPAYEPKDDILSNYCDNMLIK